MRKPTIYYWVIGITMAAVAFILCWYALGRSPLEKAAAVKTVPAQISSIRQTLDLAGTITFADQRYAIALQSGIAAWVTPKGEGEILEKDEALVRLDTSAQSQLLAQALTDSPTAPTEMLTDTAGLLNLPENQMNLLVSALSSSMVHKAQLEQTIMQCTVRAYEAGQVLRTLVRPGETVSAGAPVALLASTIPQVTAQVSHQDRQQLKVGMPVHIYQNDQPLCEGAIASIGSPITDAVSDLTAVQLAIDLYDPPALSMGEQVEARVFLYEASDVITAPLSSLDEEGRLWQVHEGRAWQLAGKALCWDDRQVWFEGLQADASIIMNPQGLQNGQRVIEEPDHDF